MRSFMAIAKALSDKNRVRVLMALGRGELCVCEIIELLGLAPSTVSKHMAILKQACLVDSRKSGRWMHYRLPGREAPAEVRGAIRWVRGAIKSDPEILADGSRAEAIRRMDKQTLCSRYNRC